MVYTTIIAMSIILYCVNEFTKEFDYSYHVPNDYILIGNKGYKVGANQNIVEIDAILEEKVIKPGIIEKIINI